MKELAYRNAAEVRSGPDFRGQVDRLIRGLEQLVAKKQELREGVRRRSTSPTKTRKMALGRARMVLELMVRDVYERRFKEPPGTRSLENSIQRLDKDGFLPGRFDVAVMLRKLGEAGTAQSGRDGHVRADVHQSITQLTDILKWYMEVEQPDALGQRPARRERPEPSRIKPTHRAVSRSPSFPRGCGRSTPTTAISSCSSSPALATRTACPRASASGSTASRPATS